MSEKILQICVTSLGVIGCLRLFNVIQHSGKDVLDTFTDCDGMLQYLAVSLATVVLAVLGCIVCCYKVPIWVVMVFSCVSGVFSSVDWSYSCAVQFAQSLADWLGIKEYSTFTYVLILFAAIIEMVMSSVGYLVAKGRAASGGQSDVPEQSALEMEEATNTRGGIVSQGQVRDPQPIQTGRAIMENGIIVREPAATTRAPPGPRNNVAPTGFSMKVACNWCAYMLCGVLILLLVLAFPAGPSGEGLMHYVPGESEFCRKVWNITTTTTTTTPPCQSDRPIKGSSKWWTCTYPFTYTCGNHCCCDAGFEPTAAGNCQLCGAGRISLGSSAGSHVQWS